MENIILNLIIGALGSIIASIVLYLLSRQYSFSASKQRIYNIEFALNCVYQIENMRNFPEDYESIRHSLECLHAHIFEIHKNIYPFTMFFSPTKKKLVQTILFDITRRCECSLFSTVGYDGIQEKKARLFNIQQYFYTPESEQNNCSVVELSLSLVKQLFKTSIFSAFAEQNMLPYKFTEFDNFIEVNSFKSDDNILTRLIRDKGLTHKEYEKLIKNLKTQLPSSRR